MQRKRRNINFGHFSGFSGKGQAKSQFSAKSKFNSSITNTTLHSIPTVRMRRNSNNKSLVAERNPFCGEWDISHFTFRNFQVNLCRVIHFSLGRFTTSRLRLARYGCGSLIRSPFVARAREKGITATKLAKNLDYNKYLKSPLYIICTLLLSFVVSNMMGGFGRECYAVVSPTASLSVSNPTLSTTVAPGDTAYLSSNVTYSASDIDSYTLQVSYANGYSSLKLDGGTTTLAGAGGKTGSSLANNSWGFAWTNNTTNNTSTNAGLTYYTVPIYGTNGSGPSTGRLENVTLPDSANNTLASTTKRIVFAAKFAENNTNSGHYKTGVQLSMVAMPKMAVDLSDVATMQELNGHPEICTNTQLISGQKYSAEYTLMDDRTYPSGLSKTYKVRKFADGRCWMTENLRINNTTLKAASSDFSGSDIVLPSSGKGDFTDANKFTYRSGLFSEANSGSTGYYNWYTATAGAGNSFVTSDNQNVNTSICPKGWTLPTGGRAGNANTESTWSDYYKLFRNMGLIISTSNLSATSSTNWGSGDLDIIQSKVDSDSKVIYNFKYTGYVYNNSLDVGTSHGYWWSSTADGAIYAYRLLIDSSSINPGADGTVRYGGYVVRCIARDF